MQVLSYGYMGVQGEDFKQTQNELLFSVPLLWFERYEKGAYEFHGERYRLHRQPTANVTPFIFVDNRESIWGGREIFGWPKALMNVQPGLSTWMDSPLKPRRLVSFYGSLLNHDDQHEMPEYLPILEVDQQIDSAVHFAGEKAPSSLAGLHDLVQTMQVAKEGYEEITGLWNHTLKSALPPGLRFPGEFIETLDAHNPGLNSCEIGVKQFRSAVNPEEACYMALGVSKSRIVKVNGAGLLGTIEQSSKRLSGGFKVRIHEHPTKPIITTLGLKLSNLETVDGHPVGTVEPIIPGWLDFDSLYSGSESLFEIAQDEIINPDLQKDELPPYENEYTVNLETE